MVCQDVKIQAFRAESVTVTNQISLIPKSRFGALLSSKRRSSGLDFQQLAVDSLGRFTVRDLQEVERGRFQIDDDAAAKVAELYGLSAGNLVPDRKELIVDFDNQFIDTSGDTMPLGHVESIDVLTRYLSLIYKMRRVEPGSPLNFRSNDINTLSEVLEISADAIEEGLNELVASHAPQLTEIAEEIESQLVVPGAGVLVAPLSAGSLVLVGATYSNRWPQPESNGPAPSSEQRCKSDPAFNQIGDQAESLISYQWRSMLPGWDVCYQPEGFEAGAETDIENRQITIYVNSAASPAEVSASLAHEIAHAIDMTYFDDADRFSWIEARGLPAVWWPGDGLTDYCVGSGDFAEAVSAAWVGSPSYSAFGEFSNHQLDMAQELVQSFR